MSISYHFRAVPTVTAGRGCIRQLAQLLTQQFPGTKQALLLSDPGLATQPIFEAARAELEHAGLRHHAYLDVVTNPPDSTAHEAAELAREFNADLIIGLGGGSTVDVAKRTRSLLRLHEATKAAPLVLIPTNPGSCAVSTDRAHAWHSDGQVQAWHGAHYLPDAVLIEHEALHTAPGLSVAAAAMHAIGTAAESMVQAPTHPLARGMAQHAIQLLSRHLVHSTEHIGEPDCRSVLAAGAFMAGLSSQACPDSSLAWLSTAISGTHRLPLTLVTAVLLPAYLTELKNKIPDTLAHIATLALPHAEGSEAARIQAFIVALQQMSRSVGLEATLPQLGFQERDIESILTLLKQSPPAKWLNEQRARAILLRAMNLCG